MKATIRFGRRPLTATRQKLKREGVPEVAGDAADKEGEQQQQDFDFQK